MAVIVIVVSAGSATWSSRPGYAASSVAAGTFTRRSPLEWNFERLRVTPFVRIECQTRLRSDEERQCDNGAEVTERVRPRYSLHYFS
jgi:hypothetical protein